MNAGGLDLTTEQHELLLDLEPEDVMAWALMMLKRYVDAGGEP